MNKFLIAALILLLPAGVLAEEEGRIATSGSITAGVQQVDPDSPSSKFNEYRDIGNGAYLYDFNFEAVDKQSGFYLDFGTENLTRDDQSARLGIGSYGTWKLDFNYDEIPHNIANNAMTVYNKTGKGTYTANDIVGIGGAAGGTPSLVPTTGEMAVNDGLVADYVRDSVHRVEIGTQRESGSVALTLTPNEVLKFRLSYKEDRKDGDKITYGPLGDRPPRTLNVMLPEPIDYLTKELKLEAEVNLERMQAVVAYQVSEFDNRIDSLQWQNIYFEPTNGDYIATVAGTTRHLAADGQRALAPDNRYQNISATAGFDLPLASRLAATVAYGWTEQDERLLPYSSSNLGLDWADTGKLARSKADAEIETTLFNLDYTINPVKRLNLRAFYRYYELDNQTDSDQWMYATQDTVNTNGTVNYRNFRVNLPYAYETQNYGLDARYSMAFWRTTLGLGVEREEIERDYREADTDENILRASISTRPTDWLSARMKYTYGDRDADGYDYNVTSQSYWYTFAQAANEVDNPQFLFANHPDLRKYDLSDRERNQFDISATVTPSQALDFTAAYNYRKDDFDSNVSPVAPLANVDLVLLPNDADANALTPGQQLGLLEEERESYNLDAHYTLNERWSFSAFFNQEAIDSKIRGMVFNENQRREPSNAGIQAITALGPWTDAERLYTTKMEDRTNTFGVGFGFEVIPGKLKLSSDYTHSRGTVEWDYSGYGTQFEDEFQFAFSSPDKVRHVQNVLNVSLEYQLIENFIVGMHYMYDRFRSDDWLAEAEGPWVQETGSEYYLQDTSLDNRWGNRLVSMGNDLGPDYDNHVGFLTMTYKF